MNDNTNIILTLIIPVYNTPSNLLHKCLDPFTQFNDSRIEVIIVDDGSDIKTANLLDEMKFAVSSRVIHKKNEGQNRARNTGVSVASGRYMGFVDSDDMVDTAVLRKMLDADLWNNDLILYEASIVDDKGAFIKKICKTSSCSKNEYVRNCAELWLQFINKDFLNRHGGLFLPDGQYIGEDLASILPLVIDSEHIAYTHFSLYSYTIHKNSIIHTLNNNRHLSILKSFDHLLLSIDGDRFTDYYSEIEWQAINHILNFESRFQLSSGFDGLRNVHVLRSWVDNHFPHWQKNPYLISGFKTQDFKFRLVLKRHYLLLILLKKINYLLMKLHS